ncbi:MAG: hypothetical protein AAFP70_16825, partial [Calditrichota bacterium]
MKKTFLFIITALLIGAPVLHAQTNEWGTDYVTLDDANNGTGDQTTSTAVFEPNRFVTIVAQTPSGNILENLFDCPGNYLVAYWDADSANGRVNSPINGNYTQPFYNVGGQYTTWEAGLDNVMFDGAYSLASNDGADRYVYVANNDAAHNILVFELDDTGVQSTDFRMETGTEDIFALDVDNNGFVYVMDFEGTAAKNNELKIFAGIGAPNTNWGGFGGHQDAPVYTMDMADGRYLGMAVSDDGGSMYISMANRTIAKYDGNPSSGYTLDANFNVSLSATDLVGNGASTDFLGIAYLNDPPIIFAAVDTFLSSGAGAGYSYARIYSYDAQTGAALDTIDVAEWNLALTGSYDSGSGNGRAGGFASLVDLDVDETEKAVYSQTYYGWAVEKWEFDGSLTGVEPISNAVPQEFALHTNYPNPFNPSTTITFDLLASSSVKLDVFNTLGQKVATLVNEQLPAGSYKTTFDAAELPSGL